MLPRHRQNHNYRDTFSNSRSIIEERNVTQPTSPGIFQPKDYPLSILSNMQLLRSKQKFCDVIITVNGKAFHCHRALLASGSPYFEAMFSSGLVEEEQHTVEIHGITPEVFTLLLDFIYSGEVEIHQNNVQDLLAASNMLELPDIVNACCNFLKTELQPSNCVGIWRFVEFHSCTNLRLEAKRFIERNFTKVIQEEEFYDLPKDMFKIFLRSEGIAIDNEFQVFQTVIEWILRDPSNRRKHVFELMEMVRLPVIPERQLEMIIEELLDLSLKGALTKIFQDHKTEIRLNQLEKKPGQCMDIRTQPRICARKNIYIIGGYNRETGRRWTESHTLPIVERLDIYRGQWSRLASMNNSRSGHAVAVLNSIIYVIGGESDSMIYNEGEAYDPLSDQWSPIHSMSQCRSVLGACALDGYIFAMGGWVGAEIGDSMERYDPLTDTWTYAGKMSIARYAMGVVAHDGLIYVVGGLNEISAEMDLVESYNPVTGEWCTLAGLVTARAHIGVTVLHDYIYAVGGTNSYNSGLTSVERYSIDENKWSEIPSMRTARAGACAAAVNGKLLVIGGRLGTDKTTTPVTLNMVEVYDPETNHWTKMNQMPTSRCEAGVAVL